MKIGDVVVVKCCDQNKSNIGRAGVVIGFLKAYEIDEEFEEDDKDGVIVRSLYGKMRVTYQDNKIEDTVDMCFGEECLEVIS
jgi:hypothetical protein